MSDGGLVECASVSVGLSGSVSVPGFVCVSACLFDLTASLGSESEILSVSSNTFGQFLVCRPLLLGKARCQWHRVA